MKSWIACYNDMEDHNPNSVAVDPQSAFALWPAPSKWNNRGTIRLYHPANPYTKNLYLSKNLGQAMQEAVYKRW